MQMCEYNHNPERDEQKKQIFVGQTILGDACKTV